MTVSGNDVYWDKPLPVDKLIHDPHRSIQRDESRDEPVFAFHVQAYYLFHLPDPTQLTPGFFYSQNVSSDPFPESSHVTSYVCGGNRVEFSRQNTAWISYKRFSTIREKPLIIFLQTPSPDTFTEAAIVKYTPRAREPS